MVTRYFHIYNRGVDKRAIFLDDIDRERFIDTLRLARLLNSPKLSWVKEQVRLGNISESDLEILEKTYGPPLIDIQAYSLMPNHFHLEVKELIEYGVSKFSQKFATSYTMYFDKRHERSGHLFESKNKTVLIETEEQQSHLSRYIHTNPSNSSEINLTTEQLKVYPWASLPDYLGLRKQPFCNPEEILNLFSTIEDYWEFTKAGIGRGELTLPLPLQIDSA